MQLDFVTLNFDMRSNPPKAIKSHRNSSRIFKCRSAFCRKSTARLLSSQSHQITQILMQGFQVQLSFEDLQVKFGKCLFVGYAQNYFAASS
jgi:hypothetical protein